MYHFEKLQGGTVAEGRLGRKTSAPLIPRYSRLDRGGCFPRAVAPKVSPSKISMVIRSCTGRAALPTCMNCKTLSRGATPPPPLLFSRGLSPGVKQCYADIRWTGLFAPRHRHPVEYPCRARLWSDRFDWSKAREIDPSVDFIYRTLKHVSSTYLCRFRFSLPRIPNSLIRSGERHRERGIFYQKTNSANNNSI